MVENDITCSTDASQTSWDQLETALDKQGITLNKIVKKLSVDLVAGGEMVGKTVCSIKGDPKGGPFLMAVKVVFPDKDKYAALLTKLTEDEALASLFEPSGPAYVRVLRCRPSFWERLKQACMKCLGWVQ